MDTEKEYINRISKGDRSAFDALFMLYYPRVKNFIFGFLKNEEDTLDLSQDIFLKLWNGRDRLVEITHFKTYLFQMSKNAVFDSFRRQSLLENYTTSQVNNYILDEVQTPENALDIKELEMLLYGLIENMPTQRKTVFNMSRQDGLSNDEIAEKLQISKRTVESHISNVLKDLKKAIYTINLFFL